MSEAEGIYINNPLPKGGIKLSKTNEMTAAMLEMLPEAEQNFAFEFVKRLVLAWDPDFTKVTPSEKAEIDHAINNGEYINAEDIDWDAED